MAGPMEGIRVVELGVWVAGPACGGILADWGADVVKVEGPQGDPFRSLEWLYPGAGNPPFDLDNRGKRSIALDLRQPDGMAAMHALLAPADVFLSNIRPGGLERMGLDYPSLAERYPRLIYASVTGFSLHGDERDRHAYDVGAFWSRAGIARSLTPQDGELPYQRGGMGDHMTGMSAAAGVAAALFHRTRTGKGQLVEASLLRLGAYMLGWDHNVTAMTGSETVAWGRHNPPNPLINCYRCADGEWFWMLGLEGDRHWPAVTEALGRTDWRADPRFADIELRYTNSEALISEMDQVIATRTRAEWGEIFDAGDVWWAPVQSTLEMLSDPQARAAGCWVSVPTPEGDTTEMVATPVDFSACAWEVTAPVPEFGQHTELILLEHGYEWETIAELKYAGVIP
ncbi:CaiB/BaiF CoA transferase family protein [Candidatus Poriferisodalis sp.]|uniref:CaiB/BaiF CoA transferase family protein n=1 Tax=Candidatus Poriferisodalis sp. TaxID=3101277 RepID=UPI003B52A8B4